jgi:hypothetical protein
MELPGFFRQSIESAGHSFKVLSALGLELRFMDVLAKVLSHLGL